MKKELIGDKDWIRGGFCVTGDDIPNNSTIGRIQIVHNGSIVCIKTRAQAEWLIKTLAEAVEHAWGPK